MSSNPTLFDNIEFKRNLAVFADGNYIFYPLPFDEEFIRREGVAMDHCLSFAHFDYCRRMRNGEIIVYSMTDVVTNTPVVDIELALTKSSYGGPVTKPSVTQIRGVRNELPPRNEYLDSLIHFLSFYGIDWQVESHGVKNFDSKCDGDVLFDHYRKLKQPVVEDTKDVIDLLQ